MKILLVGSNGFIGRHVSNLFLNQLRFNIDFIPNSRAYLATFEQKIRDEDYDYIFWLAGKINPNTAESDPFLIKTEEVRFTNALNLIMTKQKHLRSLIYLSSGGCIYRDTSELIGEESDIFPRNAYGRSKLRQEISLQESDLPHCILRVANVFGPGQPTRRGQGLIGEWIANVQSGDVCEIFGSMDHFRDYVFIEDLARAMLACTSVSNPGVINIGSGEKTTLLDMVSMFQDACGSNFRFVECAPRKFDSVGYVLDIKKANEVLSWQPYKSGNLGIKVFLQTTFKADNPREKS